MNLTFSLGNALTALAIIGGLIVVAYKVGSKIGEWITQLQLNIKTLTEGQLQHGERLAVVEREVGEIMNQRRWTDDNEERRHRK